MLRKKYFIFKWLPVTKEATEKGLDFSIIKYRKSVSSKHF